MKLKFDQFNVEIENPTIEINPVVKEVDPLQMTISVDIVLVSGSSKFGVRLDQVKVQNLTYTSETLYARVLERLKDFEIQ